MFVRPRGWAAKRGNQNYRAFDERQKFSSRQRRFNERSGNSLERFMNYGAIGNIRVSVVGTGRWPVRHRPRDAKVTRGRLGEASLPRR